MEIMSLSVDLKALAVSFAAGYGGSVDMPCRPGKFYVYVHKGPDGTIFYVGKGTGNRAYSKDRQPEWYYWVDKILKGQYTVEIVRDGISEDDAHVVEDAVMFANAETIINLQNIHAPVDSQKLVAYSDTMREYTDTFRKAEKLETGGKLDNAIEVYEQAYALFAKVISLSDYTMGARQLLPPGRMSPTQLSDRYSKCLAKAGRHAAVVELTGRYFTDYGEGQEETGIETALKKRAEKSRAKLQG